jgi:hypothetical protein
VLDQAHCFHVVGGVGLKGLAGAHTVNEVSDHRIETRLVSFARVEPLAAGCLAQQLKLEIVEYEAGPASD